MLRRENLYSNAVEEPWGVGGNIRRLIRPVVELVVAEEADIGHEDSGVDIDPMQGVEVVTAVRFGEITIGVVQIPLATRRAGIVARRGLRIQTKLRHQTRANIIIMKVATDAELRYLDFIGPENLARPADGVVFGMIEIVDVIDVGPDFRRKELGIQRRFFGSRVAGQPGKVCERKWLGLRWLGAALLVLFRGLRPDRGGHHILGDSIGGGCEWRRSNTRPARLSRCNHRSRGGRLRG